MIFSAGTMMQLYLNRFFLSAYGEWKAAAWSLAYVDPGGNRTWNGSMDALSKLVPEALAGRTPFPAPDPERFPVDVASMNELPLPGVPVDDEYLPRPFIPTRPPLKLRPPDAPAAAAPGLREELFDAAWGADLDTLQPTSTGSIRRLHGFLDVPKDGVYLLTLVSTARAKLSLGEDLWIASEGGTPAPERGADAALKAGRHAIRIVAESPIRLLWAGSGIERQPVPAERLSHDPR